MLYLDGLEEELGIVDESARARTLFAKLRSDIQTPMILSNNKPEGREELISYAIRVEGNLKTVKRVEREDSRTPRVPSDTTPREPRGETNPRRDGRYPGSSPNPGANPSANSGARRGSSRGPGPSRPSGVSDVNRIPIGARTEVPRAPYICFHCNKPGHLIANCPERGCYNCGDKGHLRRDCTKPSRTGNEGARS